MSDAAVLFNDGAAYERRMGRWSRVAGEAFLDWLDVPSGLRWLDVGCGNGAFTEVLIDRAAPSAVTGIDRSQGQIDYARARRPAPQARFQTGDAQTLPFPDDSFDAAAMALVISFVADPFKAAAEMARVVQPGGLVGAYMWDIAGGGLPVQPIRDALEFLGIPNPLPGIETSRRGTMQKIWERAGLKSVETRVIRVPISATFDDFWESNTGTDGSRGQIMRQMASDTREKLRARLLEVLSIDAGGRVAFQAVANAVKGRVPG